MEPITKDFLTTILATSFGAFRIEMQEEFKKVRQEFNIRFDYLEGEIRDIRTELKEFKTETQENFKEIRRDLDYLGEKVFDGHEKRITKLESAVI